MSKICGVASLLSAWRHFTTGSVNRKILGATVTIALFTGLVKLVYVAQELVVAWKFGTTDAVDAFLVAFSLLAFAVGVVAESFNAALIPTYIRVQEQEGSEAAQRIFSSVVVCGLVLLGVTTLLMVITAPLYLPLVARGFSPEKLSLAYRLLCILAPIVLLKGIKVIGGAALNAEEQFTFVAFSQIVTPVVAVMSLSIDNDVYGIFPLAVSLVIGTALEVVILAPALQRQGIGLQLRWYGFDSHMRQVAGQYAPMVAGAFLMSSTIIVDQSMAAMLPAGSVAAFNYGTKVVAFPLYLTATALGTAVLPYFSKMIVQEDWMSIRHTLRRYLRLIFSVTIPATVIFVLFSRPLVELIFQRGVFTAEDTKIVSNVQTFYALQIPFYMAGILVVRLISSLQANFILMRASLYNMISNIILNYLFMQYWGVAGIAISTTFVYLISFIYCWMMLDKQLSKMELSVWKQ